jgi:hypothetical protein
VLAASRDVSHGLAFIHWALPPEAADVDTIKTRYQTQHMHGLDETKPLIAGERKYISTWHCVKETFRQDGVGGMYRGMGVTMVRAFIGKFPLSVFTKSMQLHFMVTNG